MPSNPSGAEGRAAFIAWAMAVATANERSVDAGTLLPLQPDWPLDADEDAMRAVTVPQVQALNRGEGPSPVGSMLEHAWLNLPSIEQARWRAIASVSRQAYDGVLDAEADA
jgi:hypothetical protein